MYDDALEAFMSRKMSRSLRKGGLCIICCLLSLALLPICNAMDKITSNQNITDGETLVSSGNVFELGFFSPDKKSPRKAAYLGMWYHGIEPQTVVWVANRDRPVTDYPGVFAMTNDGNLQVIDGKGSVLWSALPGSGWYVEVAVLLDNGNLVLNQGNSTVWQSFSDVSDTFLPGMNMEKKFLQSWKNNSNPALGEFTFSLSSGTGRNQFKVLNHTAVYWMSGWSDDSFSVNDLGDCLVSMMFPDYGNACSVVMADAKVRLVMSSSGQIELLIWGGQSSSWILYWTEPKDACSFYNTCGDYGVCSIIENKAECDCLPGFVPNSVPQWKSGDYSSGCKREIIGCTDNDYFEDISLDKVGYPDYPFQVNSEKECKEGCKKKCCNAYLFEADQSRGGDSYTCQTWSRDSDSLKNLKSSLSLEVILWIRAVPSTAAPDHTCSSSEDCRPWLNSACQLNADGREKCLCVPGFHWDSAAGDCTPDKGYESPSRGSTQYTKRSSWILPLGITAGVALLAFAAIGIGCLWRMTVGRRSQRNTISGKLLLQNEESDRGFQELVGFHGLQEDRTKSIDVPFYDFEMIVAATNNFSLSNKLGQGGFGPVYKGNFPGGQEVAVKRLSRSSGQGLEEFKNEVLLIAKLQHRNLVRLLGYCMKGEDEKMLIYEYMPNRSLDSIVFDQEKRVLLNWEMRYNIILGVARGLLYLHQDSRLRIIHRDLKTSNILLDEEMNPKISDFGMARIFGGKQIEANTNRVVGTYGYMSPEYAIDGLFSIKSDVFSFGIIVLEIISGKRNKLFYHEDQALPLLGHAWKLWNEDTGLDLMDGFLREDCNHGQALKCIQIALLCVQDNAVDRPTMSEVMALLSSETAVVPCPKQPAFFVKRFLESMPSSSSSKAGAYSGNELTTTFDGR